MVKQAAGTIFLSTSTGRCLLNLRSNKKSRHGLTCSLLVGMIEKGETPIQSLHRELEEEMGFVPDIEKTYPVDIYESNDKKFRYYSFVSIVNDEFIPVLNKESLGYCWTSIGNWPRPLHIGAKITLIDNDINDKLRKFLQNNS